MMVANPNRQNNYRHINYRASVQLAMEIIYWLLDSSRPAENLNITLVRRPHMPFYTDYKITAENIIDLDMRYARTAEAACKFVEKVETISF